MYISTSMLIVLFIILWGVARAAEEAAAAAREAAWAAQQAAHPRHTYDPMEGMPLTFGLMPEEPPTPATPFSGRRWQDFARQYPQLARFYEEHPRAYRCTIALTWTLCVLFPIGFVTSLLGYW